MRLLPLIILLLTLAPAAMAQSGAARHPAAPPAKTHAAASPPKSIGQFADWAAATHEEGGQMVCYAFTRAIVPPAAPNAPAAAHNDNVLTVTQRPSGRDAVAITTGFSFAANAAVTVSIDQTNLDFYTAQRAAFARDGKAAIAAFMKGRQAFAHEPGPRNTMLTDSFSLRGFDQAYAAINKACPPK
jgi:hypothetical protein